MLTALSIRDVVLIERLDLSFGDGLTVLTGETGAGKSILLDSLGTRAGCARRCRAGARRRRTGQRHRLLRAAAGHPVAARCWPSRAWTPTTSSCCAACSTKDGRSRAFINDQPVGVALLRRAGALLVEVQGQHEQMGLADPASHAALLDAFGVPPPLRDSGRNGVAAMARCARRAGDARDGDCRGGARRGMAAPRGRRTGGLAPREGEEERWRDERQRLQQGERRARGDRRGACRTGAARPAERRPGRGACGRHRGRCSGWSRPLSRMRSIRQRRR